MTEFLFSKGKKMLLKFLDKNNYYGKGDDEMHCQIIERNV